MAFPLGHVCVGLISRHPTVGEILNARLVKKCPYVVPQYFQQTPGQSLAEYRKKVLRYRLKSGDLDGTAGEQQVEWESQEQYEERMCGMLALYMAILQTTAPGLSHVQWVCCYKAKQCAYSADLVGAEMPFAMEQIWKWLARILNLPPRHITPRLLGTFVDVAGAQFVDTYAVQAHKLLQLVRSTYVAAMEAVPAEMNVGAVVRLKNTLEKYVGQNGRIDPHPARAVSLG